MKTLKRLVFLLSLLFTLNSLLYAQKKTFREELNELRERTRQLYEMSIKDSNYASNANEKSKPVNNSNIVTSTNLPKNKKWTLEECIQYAIIKNLNIKQLQLAQEEAEIQKNTAESSRLPNLNVSMRNEWSFGKSESLTGEFNDLNLSNTNIDVQSTMPVFTGFRIPNQIARADLDFKAATQNLEKAKEDLSIHITSLFLQANFYMELFNISEKQLELSNMQVGKTKLLIQAGNVPKSQLFDIEAQVAKDTVAAIEALNNYEIALLDLAQSLELERNAEFDIFFPVFEGDIISMFIRSLQPPDIIYRNALTIKPAIKGQAYKVESARKTLKIAESGYYPQIDFFIGMGTRYHHIYKPSSQINPITLEPIELNPTFSKQISNYGAKYFGFSLTIPVFNRFQTQNQVRSAWVDILNQQLILENTKKSLYKEIQTAYKNATAALEKYRASERAVKSANESFEYVRKRYELGTATVFEYNEARTRLIQSQSEQVQAKYEFILRTKILDFYNGTPIRL